MYTDPFDAIDLREFLKKFGKGSAMIKVKTVVCRILSNDDELPYSVFSKSFSLLYEILDRNRLVGTSDERNCTV